jgi:hypothetical protein
MPMDAPHKNTARAVITMAGVMAITRLAPVILRAEGMGGACHLDRSL